jgi:hypothetical protein
MYVKKIKPITPSQRHTLLLNKKTFQKINKSDINELKLQI